MKRKGKTKFGTKVLYAFLGLGIIAALIGSGIAISRGINNKISTTNTTSQTTGGNQNTQTSEDLDDDTGPSDTGGNSSQNEQSSGGNESGQQGGNSESQSGGDNTSGNEEHETTDSVQINCSAGEVYWYNNVDDSTSWNTLSVVCALNGLPSNATASDKGLYIYCDDDALDQWIEISVMRSGSKVILNSPYAFQSGETITLTQKKAAPLTGFYKIPLWIFATNYDTEQVYHIIDVWFRTNA